MTKKPTQDSAKSPNEEFDAMRFFDPLNLSKAFMELGKQFAAHPDKFMAMQSKLSQAYIDLFKRISQKANGEIVQSMAEPEKGDRRFKSTTWQDNPYFDFIKQAYLITAQEVIKTVQDFDDLPPHTRQKVEFFTRQFVDAYAPSNFFFTNPDVLAATLDSKGENLRKGFENWLQDIDLKTGKLNIRKTNYEQFEVGKNIASTEGAVIYQNDLIQLIHYKPKTAKQYQTPVLIVPPWINKYYILDLRPENSMVNFLLEQGHAVFIISWVNPDKQHAQKDFEDYLQDGFLAALEQVQKTTKQKQVATVAYCLGGTLTSCGLAWLKSKNRLDEIVGATFLTTLIDFNRAGELKVFLDRESVDILEDTMEKEGYLPAEFFQSVFSMMRSNDLIWSFFVNNYLLGRDPMAFDLLYWNDDSTRLPAKMQSFYLRNMYVENRLRSANEISLLGAPIDIATIDCPLYFLSAKEDHIAPWKATYDGAQLLKDNPDIKFVLSEAGHIAGVVNPPTGKYGYWVNPDLSLDDESWFNGATHHQESWWIDWQNWLKAKSGPQVAPYNINAKQMIEPAPGHYVKIKA